MLNRQLRVQLLQFLILLRARRNLCKLNQPRKFWVNPVYQQRATNGEFARIYLPMKRLAEQNDLTALRRFYQYVRMDFTAFMKLLDLLRERYTF